MLSALLLVGGALRAGLRLRRRRFARAPFDAALLRRHLRLAKPAVALCLVGFVGGPLSAALFRGWTPFRSFHSWVGLLAAALFAVTYLLGRRLERARGTPPEAHARVALLAALVAALAAVAGFVLLP